MESILVNNNALKTENTEIDQNDKVKLTSAGGIAVKAGSTDVSADNDDRGGWLYNKTQTGTSKFNYYIYGNVGSSHQFTFQDLKSIHMTTSIDKWDDTTSIPFIIVYSKPTGTNDAESWYHSKRTYNVNINNQQIVVGEHINLYAINKPNLKNNNRYIECEILTTVGDNQDSEEILYITLHSDSSSPINTKILTTDAGYNFNHKIKRNIKFVS